MGYGTPPLTEREAIALYLGTSGAESMRIDAESREGALPVEVLGRPEVAAISELQSSSLEGIGGTCGILTGPELGPFADVGVTGRDPDKDGVPDETALLLSLAISGSLGDGCEDAEAEFLEFTDAGEALRESRAAGGKESYGDRVALRGYPFEDAIG